MYVKRKRLCYRLKAAPGVVAGVLFILLLSSAVSSGAAQPPKAANIATKTSTYSMIQVGGSRLQIDLEGPTPDLPKGAIEERIRRAAQAIAVYYGHFPVSSARIVVLVSPGQDGMLQGTTWEM
jgi:hypothetical protein